MCQSAKSQQPPTQYIGWIAQPRPGGYGSGIYDWTGLTYSWTSVPYATLAIYASVAIARIRADAVSRSIVDPAARAAAKLDQFLRELRMDVNLLNVRAKEDLHHLKFTRDGQTGAGIFALREIADMIYRESDAAMLNVATAADVDFKADKASELKIFLAPLSGANRLAWLINKLMHKTVLRAEDDFSIQLTIDFGLVASREAAAKLSTMRTANREQYGYMGFVALFSVLKGVGDKEPITLMQQFLTDQDDKVRHYEKQVYADVASGTPWQTKIAY